MSLSANVYCVCQALIVGCFRLFVFFVFLFLAQSIAIERLRVRTQAGAAGEFTSPELTSCVDSYSVSVPPHVAGYT